MLRRIHDPVLLVQIDHGRLDIGVAQHGLDLSDGRPMVERECGGRMAQRMGRDRTEALGLRIEQPRETGLLQMRPHHRLNRPDPQRPAATTVRDIPCLRVVFARAPQPTEERMLGEQATKGRVGVRDRMVPGIMQLKVGGEGFQHPGGQHHRLLRRIAALTMQIQNRMAVALIEMPPLRPREFNTPGTGTDPEERHGIIPPAPLLSPRVRIRQLKGVHEPGDFGFRQTIPHKPFGELQALDLPHRVIRNLARLLEPGTKGAQAREVGIDRPRSQPGAGPLPFGGGQEAAVTLQQLGREGV